MKRSRRLRREDFESNDNHSTAPDAIDAGDAHDNRELDKDNGPDKEPDHTEDPGNMEIMTKSGAATEILDKIQTMSTEDVFRLRSLLLGEEDEEKRGDDDLFDKKTEEPVDEEEEEEDDEEDEPKEESYLGEEDEEPEGGEEDEDEDEDEDKEPEEGDDDVKVNIDNLKKEDLKLDVSIDSLFESGKFSPKFKKDVKEIFEAAVLANVNRMIGSVNEMANRELRILGKRQRAQLVEHADRYLTSVARQFVAKNKLAIDNGIKAEMFDSMVAGISQVMHEHNLAVPSGKRDLVEQLLARLDRVEGKLNEQITVNMMMSEDLEALGREYALLEATEGMSRASADKLVSLSEGFDYDDHDRFVNKLKKARESIFESRTGGDAERRTPRSEALLEDFNPVTPSPENGVNDSIVDVVAQQIARSAGKV